MSNMVRVEEKALLEASAGKTNYTNPTTPIKVRLTTAVGSTTAAGTEVTGGSYASQTVVWNAATSADPSVVTSNGALTYTSMPAATVTSLEIWDSAGTPIRRWFGNLTASKTTNSGDTFTIADTALSLSLG